MGSAIESAAALKPEAEPASLELRRLLTVTEVADLLQCSKQAVYSWVEVGELEHFKIGRLVRFSADHVRSFLSTRHRSAQPRPWTLPNITSARA